MYADKNFPTKKALAEALSRGETVRATQPGPFPPTENGPVALEGPWYPQPHTWYARATLKDGVIIPSSLK